MHIQTFFFPKPITALSLCKAWHDKLCTPGFGDCLPFSISHPLKPFQIAWKPTGNIHIQFASVDIHSDSREYSRYPALARTGDKWDWGVERSTFTPSWSHEHSWVFVGIVLVNFFVLSFSLSFESLEQLKIVLLLHASTSNHHYCEFDRYRTVFLYIKAWWPSLWQPFRWMYFSKLQAGFSPRGSQSSRDFSLLCCWDQ